MSEQIEELESEKYDRIARAIQGNPEWFMDLSFDDEDVVSALTIAADALRRIGK